jgi:glycogenin glucosyltransferase
MNSDTPSDLPSGLPPSAYSGTPSDTHPAVAATVAAAVAARRPYRGGRAAPEPGEPAEAGPRCAWVVLLMIGKAYAPGALVVAYSLRLLRTRHELVCMVTADVPSETRAQLAVVYDRVVEIPYIAHKARPLASQRQIESYSGWLDRSFTKWNCLGLTDYTKVAVVDADIVFLTNCDDLFDLRSPAACYSLPWAYPWQRTGGIPNPYLACRPDETAPECDLPHGSRIPAATVMAALHERTFVGGGFLDVLAPDAAKLAQLLALIDETEVYGAGYATTSAADETSIAELYAREGTDWTHIHQRYAAIPWKKDWVSRDIRAYHYLGRKPWDMDPEEWPDLADWWRVADRLVARAPVLRELFYPTVTEVAPLDADSAQLRLTNDLRALILSPSQAPARGHKQRGRDRARGRERPRDKRAAWREADNVLERWLMALVNTPGPADSRPAWARVYRRSTLEEGFNNKLAGELVEKGFAPTAEEAGRLVVQILATVDRRLGRLPRPSGAAPACGEEAIRYGAHFRADLTPRLARLVELGGCERAAAVALRYAVVVSTGQQWGLPQAHIDYLYDRFGVRREAFASPLNARLLGKPDARYCSVFPDTDAPFGSIGDFLSRPPRDLDGNWVVNPPFVEDLLARAARLVTDALLADEGRAQTFFFIIPAWTDSEAYAILRESPFLAAELRLEPGRYFYEDAAGRRIDTRAPSIYFALSTEGLDVRTRLAGRRPASFCGPAAQKRGRPAPAFTRRRRSACRSPRR